VSRAIFAIMGGISLLFACAIVLIGLLSAGHWSQHVPPLNLVIFLKLMAYVLGLSVLGVGLLGGRKWAALVFSLITLYLAYKAFENAISSVPWSWSGIGYWWGLLLLSPLVLTAKYWRTLVWRSSSKTLK